MGNRKTLRAYIRTTKTGKPIPGSVILRDKQPTGMRFKPLIDPTTYVCCDPFGAANCSKNTWAMTQTTTSENFYFGYLGSGIDNNCNTYAFMYYYDPENNPAILDYYNELLLQKFDKDGVIVWQKTITFSTAEVPGGNLQYNESSFYVDVANKILYCIFNNGVLTFDFDGNPLWGKVFQQDTVSDYYFAYFGGADSTGNFYMAGGVRRASGYYTRASLIKLDPLTGNIIKEIKGSAGENEDDYFWTFDINSNGDIVTCYQPPSQIEQYTTKFDKDLNLQWCKIPNINTLPDGPTAYYGSSPQAIGIDEAGNIYVPYTNGSGERSINDGTYQLLVKFSSSGDLEWGYTLDINASPGFRYGAEAIYIDKAKGGIFWSGPNYNSAVTPNELYTISINPDSTTNFMYSTVNAVEYLDTYWYDTPLVGVAKNQVLTAAYYGYDYAVLTKLPQAQGLSGVYGDFTFTDIASRLTPTVYTLGSTDYSPTFLPSTSVSESWQSITDFYTTDVVLTNVKTDITL